MKQIFHPYYKWECYKNGMWQNSNNEGQLIKAIEFTSNHELYGDAMFRVSKLWKYSCENFLSNVNINRRAYIGHAAVCFELGIPEIITRKAWKHLNEKQQIIIKKNFKPVLNSGKQKEVFYL